MSLFAGLSRRVRLALPAPAPVADYPFFASDVALYQRLVHGEAGALDAQTWSDLMLPQYSACLAPGTCIFGQQELHRRLQLPGGGAPAARTEQLRALLADAGARQRLQTACEGLRRAESEVSATLFGPPLAPAPRWVWLLGARWRCARL